MAVQIDGSQGKVIATSGDYSGGVSIGGTLTYEDVTNIDAVGLITARSGIEIGASPGVGASISVDGNAILSGITTFKGTSNFGEHLLADSGYLKLTSEADGAQIRVGAAQDFQVEHDGSNTYLANTTGDLVFQNDANIKFTLKTGGTERVRVGAGGSVGIGIAAPNSMLHVEGAEGRAQLTLGNTNAAASDGDFLAGIDFHIKDNNDATGSVCSAIRTYADQNHTATAKGTAIAFHTTDDDTVVLDERVRIDHYGALLVGLTTPTYASGDMRHEIKKNNTRAYTSSDMVQHSHLLINNSDTSTSVFAGIGFRAGSGDGAIGYVYGNGANNADFVVNTDGNNNGTERLRVYNNGAVLIGAHSNEAGGNARLSIDCEGLDVFDGVGDPANYGLIFANDPTSNKANGIGFFNDSAGTCGGYIVHQDKGGGNIGDIVFGTASTSDTPVRRMTLTSAGNLFHGCTTSPDTDDPGTSFQADANQGQLRVATNSSGSAVLCTFYNANGNVGDIRTSGSGTSYNTSSDYRLKENAVAISDGITRLKTLKPYRFNFKKDPSTTVDGFFAHEVTAVPESITGTKDQVATSEDVSSELLDMEVGDPIYQSIDQAKLVPLLTAALQEEISKREALEARVAALESS